jgi:NTP pyrophosphatase (non-canonical NTP hydrolase)
MFEGKLNEFCKINNKEVRAKGFWQSMDNALNAINAHKQYCDTGKQERKIDEDYNATKDAFIAQKVALVMSKCGEALEAMRKQNYGLEKKDTFEDEIADVMIRLCDLCGELNIDIEKQIEWKINHNKSRENKHGKSF